MNVRPLAKDDGAPPKPAKPAAALPPHASAAPEADHGGRPHGRRVALLGLGAVVAAALVAYALKVAVFSTPSQTTDDAYVGGDVVEITSREPSIITALYADNTQSVKRGQLLIDMDSSTADANRAQAEADLGHAVRAVRSDFARVDETAAEVTSAQTDLSRAQDDLARRNQAVVDGAVSNEEVSHAADAVRTARAALELARSRHAEALAVVQGATIETNPDVLAAEAAVRRVAIVQKHMRINAPVDGVVAERTVQLGQQVQPGAPLMAVVPLSRVWVDANFRETQLAGIRVGQPVTLTSEAYGSHTVFHGRIEGLGAGTGVAFALLPPQNASGNWIKIVQRLPTRIALDPAELVKRPLQIGLSVKVRVDTRDHSGVEVARAAAGHAFQVIEPEDAGPAVKAQIAKIVAQNRG